MLVYKRVTWRILWWWECSISECINVNSSFAGWYHCGQLGKGNNRLSLHYFLQPHPSLQLPQNKRFNENMIFKGYLLHRKMALLQHVKKQNDILNNDDLKEYIYLYICWAMYILYVCTHTHTKSKYMPSLTNGNTKIQLVVKGEKIRFFLHYNSIYFFQFSKNVSIWHL